MFGSYDFSPARAGIAFAAVLATTACPPPGPTGGLQADLRAEIPGGSASIPFDDVWYAQPLGKVLLAAGTRGVAVIDPETAALVMIAGPQETYSVTEGGGRLFAIDRGQSRLLVVDPGGGGVVGSRPLSGVADYGRTRPAGELLVSPPFDHPIEVLRPPLPRPFAPAPVAHLAPRVGERRGGRPSSATRRPCITSTCAQIQACPSTSSAWPATERSPSSEPQTPPRTDTASSPTTAARSGSATGPPARCCASPTHSRPLRDRLK